MPADEQVLRLRGQAVALYRLLRRRRVRDGRRQLPAGQDRVHQLQQDGLGRHPPQACVSDDFGIAWYTCAASQPPFMGCCAVNPYQAIGCPASALRAAALSTNRTDADALLHGRRAAASSGSASAGAPSATGRAPRRRSGAAGLSVGATAAALVLAAALVVWLRRRFEVKRRKQAPWDSPGPAKGADAAASASAPPYHGQHHPSPNPHGAVSPCTSPGHPHGSPYAGFQPSPRRPGPATSPRLPSTAGSVRSTPPP